MITLFNRKKLFTDVSLEEVSRVTEAFKKHGMQYEVVTKRSQTPLEMSFHANAGSRLGHGDSKTSDYCMGEISFVYHVYVRRQDYEAAKKLMN